MTHFIKYLLGLGVLIYLGACSPVDRQVHNLPNIDFNDDNVLRILSAQDKRLSDSLLIYFQSADPNHRYLAARAFGSVQDQRAIPQLLELLEDQNYSVRGIAAFALGQIRSEKAEQGLTAAFVPNDSIQAIMRVDQQILEALGKCGTNQSLSFISSIRSYGPEDSLLVQGQTASLYRFGLRGMTDSLGTERMIEILENGRFDPLSRLFAVNYLYRFRDINLDPYASRLVAIYIKEQDAQVKLFLPIVLGRTNAESVLNQLLGDLNSRNIPDNLKCNILRSLDGFTYEQVRNSILPLLHSPNNKVVRTAIEYLKRNAKAYDADYYWGLAKADTIKRLTRSLLYEVTNTIMPATRAISKSRLNQEISKAIDATRDPYIKNNYIDAFAKFGWNYQLIANKTKAASHPVVKTNGIRAIANIYKEANDNRAFNVGRVTVKRNIARIMAEALSSKDIGMITEAASLLADTSTDIANYYRDTIAFAAAFDALDLPKDYETYQVLVRASNHLRFGDIQSTEGALMYNHPIDFKQLAALSDSSRAIIDTEKGRMIIELYPKHAPGSVHNFIELAASNFFKGKNFHRVVPNFVVQGGCTRGDGYGIEDYTIRSEFSTLRYDEGGYLGMASSGKDTEGTQFFITHNAALHLDGYYSIFAKVLEGMDVVDDIEVGDKINEVKIIF